MIENPDIPMHEPKIIEHLEIGGGREPGTSIYDISPTIRKNIDAGATTLTVDKETEGLGIPHYGAVRKEAMQVFANSNYLHGRVRNIYLNNVCGERDSGIVNEFAAKTFLAGLKNKLTPDGKIVIVENYTPSEVSFLKSIDYSSLGIKAEITQTVDEYREKMKSFDLTETKAAKEFALKYSAEYDISWEPFVIVLSRLDAARA